MPFPAFFLLAAALGTREHLRSRRTGKRMLDQEAERQDEINSIDIGISSMGVANQFDARQIQVLAEQTQTAQGMLRSKDPRLQALGASMLQAQATAVRSTIQTNETEARADVVRQQDQEIAAAGLGRDAEEKRFDRGLTMNRQLHTELKPFLLAQANYEKTKNLLDQNDQLASLAGLTAFVQSIDNSVVREGELVKYKGANGLITELVNIINKSAGKDFSVTTKQSLRNASAALINAEKARAVTITNSFQDRAVAWALDVDGVMSGVDDTLFTQIEYDQKAQLAAQEQADLAESQFNEADFTEKTSEVFGFNVPGTQKRVSFDPAANIANRLVRPFIEMTEAVGIPLRGARFLEKNDGTLWIKETDGSMSAVTNRDFKNLERQIESGGVRLPADLQRRVDAGELDGGKQGFLERLLSPEASAARRKRFPNIRTDPSQ